MKVTKLIAKIVVALAAIAGAVYVMATYGNQIVAWCKKILASLPCCDCGCDCECCCGGECNCGKEDIEEEIPAEEVVEEVVAEELPADETVVVEEGAPVADDNDFEG